MHLTAALTAALVAGLTACGSSAGTSTNILIARSRSIGPITVGEAKTRIEAAYGKGQPAALPGRPHNTPITFYPALSIGVLYYESRAIYVETTEPEYRTTSGVGVGSTVAELRRAGAECQQDQCGIVEGNLATTFFMSPSFLAHRPSQAIRVVVGPLGN